MADRCTRRNGAGNVYLDDPVQDASGNFIYSQLNNQHGSINNRGSEGDSYYNGLNLGLQMTDLERTGLIIYGKLHCRALD